jgi:hypothetical protein
MSIPNTTALGDDDEGVISLATDVDGLRKGANNGWMVVKTQQAQQLDDDDRQQQQTATLFLSHSFSPSHGERERNESGQEDALLLLLMMMAEE